ncbi:ubiquinone biosynthesis regulatory protein kinase UbiB [Pokkaliibacter sp. MBI-7]|uniref:ubiquinone biosynthesis regulatory protein kinase UbiB n=1 Tax=Pokkaliibacter sp. MBI-7 TaxID=3040600 RepID=UPI00244CD8B0|nr:ubiquinone biosynthesis regulatory protein kinase UbiB [Pokkaliibacter sp. MBI-7]MDH2433528.1 ubiquinone biosynthesis regulatory protein kinase UbiB [Pokkaliibacter sp. MBI-7]
MIRLLRIFTIIRVIAQYRLDDFIPLPHLPWYMKLGIWMLPWRWYQNELPRGERLRCALEELGPVFVKFGQVLSTRRDLLPNDIADELQKLQDRVPPFPGDQALRIIEASLGHAISEVFTSLDIKPLASASIAQVHAAVLHTGEQVVVKVTRPGIASVIRKDVALMMAMARMVARFSSDGRRLRPVEVVRDYERTLFDELDLQREAANAAEIRRNFDNSESLYVPQIYWEYTRKHIMVMERISGIPVADIAALRDQGIDFRKLAERGVEIFFTQVFRDNFFHADMHPGNIFVSREHPHNPQYIAIDFGIVGSLTPEDQQYLARNLLAFFKRDYRQVAQLHVDSGWVPAHTPVHDFEAAIRTVCEPIFQKPLKDISFGHVLLGLFQTARRFNMEVQPQLVLLEKTLLNIEGLGRQLYPELDLWATAKPFLENWMKERVGIKGLYKRSRKELPDLLDQLPHLPQLTLDALQQVRRLEQTMKEASAVSTGQRPPLRIGQKIGVAGIAIAAVTLWQGGWQWLQQGPASAWLVLALGLALLWQK